ncbi:MAG: hypothetical protein DU429_00855 [Candidatus Tokpelaia sp.]|uniref:hypothetical protein n=1 Tax=Candidatus Tokpelaia sp. TaxID=2233777 RepID=UPI00123AC010|nr:hypothetical protein [Candidatus Tokpelaia sp.]KAA6205330.1 MAG: hypothetical protein DU430_04905 [Candidatus Tokpelaia sp.]KAA6207639.1 MAG: hypothetical protein DU429_00855 [Candidatus Tokpelaia sp.]KAA6404811.1 hypothetical protein DPQ22_07780 [Candidatus Tokpelaia sp.]
MHYIGIHLPLIIAAVLSAMTTTGLLGRTHSLSLLFGTGQIAVIADSIFFVFTLLYCLLLWQARQHLSPRFFCLCLWGIIIINLLVLLL